MNIGAVVGRFQVAELSAGHRFLINKAISSHDRAIVFLGVPRFQGTKRNPLDYDVRARMIQAEFPGVIVLPIHDVNADEEWSQNLDKAIENLFPRLTSATYYGGRDSFIPHYSGKHATVEVVSNEEYISGTSHRAAIGRNPRYTSDFRAGCVYFVENQFPSVKPTVDIAVIQKGFKHGEITEIVLGKKPGEDKWRLPGGFVDPTDADLVSAAARELREEVPGIDTHGISAFKYVGSVVVDDPRIKGNNFSILTSVFLVEKAWGSPRAGDDLAMATWFDLDSAEHEVVAWHKPLIRMIREYLNKKE